MCKKWFVFLFLAMMFCTGLSAVAQDDTPVFDPRRVIASAVMDPDAVIAVVQPLNLQEPVEAGTILDIPADPKDGSMRYLMSKLSLTLLEVRMVLSPDAKLPRIIHVIGVKPGMRVLRREGQPAVHEQGPIFSDHDQPWLVMLKPLVNDDHFPQLPEAAKHLKKYRQKGINFFTLYNAGRGAYKLMPGKEAAAAALENVMPFELIPDIAVLAKASKQAPGRLGGHEAWALQTLMKTGEGAAVALSLPEAQPLADLSAEDAVLPTQPAAALSSTSAAGSPACAGIDSACPIANMFDVIRCVP